MNTVCWLAVLTVAVFAALAAGISVAWRWRADDNTALTRELRTQIETCTLRGVEIRDLRARLAATEIDRAIYHDAFRYVREQRKQATWALLDQYTADTAICEVYERDFRDGVA